MGNYDIIHIMNGKEYIKRTQELLKVAHGEDDPIAFCNRAHIDSVRNLEVYLKHAGLIDGHYWTYGELASAYNFSRPRAVQICQRTEKHIKEYYQYSDNVECIRS